MNNKQVEQEETKLNQSIMEKETQLDILKQQQKQIQNSFDSLTHDLTKSFRELSYLNGELIHFGGQNNRETQQQNEEQARYFKQQLSELEEELSFQYKKEVTSVSKEKADLYRKRSELNWD